MGDRFHKRSIPEPDNISSSALTQVHNQDSDSKFKVKVQHGTYPGINSCPDMTGLPAMFRILLIKESKQPCGQS